MKRVGLVTGAGDVQYIPKNKGLEAYRGVRARGRERVEPSPCGFVWGAGESIPEFCAEESREVAENSSNMLSCGLCKMMSCCCQAPLHDLYFDVCFSPGQASSVHLGLMFMVGVSAVLLFPFMPWLQFAYPVWTACFVPRVRVRWWMYTMCRVVCLPPFCSEGCPMFLEFARVVDNVHSAFPPSAWFCMYDVQRSFFYFASAGCLFYQLRGVSPFRVADVRVCVCVCVYNAQCGSICHRWWVRVT